MPAKDRSKRLKSHQETFRRNWFSAFRNVAARVSKLTPGDLRPAMPTLDASLLTGRLTVKIGDAQIIQG